MNPCQYVICQRRNGLSKGKMGAQTAHASVMGLLAAHGEDGTRNPFDASIVNRWLRGGHYAKVVLECENLHIAERYIRDRGFKTALIIDEGRTEIDALTPTAIGTGVVDKDSAHVQETFSVFKTYDDLRGVTVREATTREAFREAFRTAGMSLLATAKEKGDALRG